MRKSLLVLVPLLLLGGCLDYDEVLALKADGSGTLRLDMTVDLAFSDRLRALATPAGEKPPEDADDPYRMMVSKEDVLKQVQGVDGVTVTQCLVEEPSRAKGAKGTKVHVKLVLDFKSIEALSRTHAFEHRELSFAEKDGKVAATYRIDAGWLKEQSLLWGPDDPEPTDALEKKMRKTVEEATKAAHARFTVHFPVKPLETKAKADENDPNAVRVEVAKGDAKAHAALVKEPLVLEATLPAKGTEALVAASAKAKDAKK